MHSLKLQRRVLPRLSLTLEERCWAGKKHNLVPDFSLSTPATLVEMYVAGHRNYLPSLGLRTRKAEIKWCEQRFLYASSIPDSELEKLATQLCHRSTSKPVRYPEDMGKVCLARQNTVRPNYSKQSPDFPTDVQNQAPKECCRRGLRARTSIHQW